MIASDDNYRTPIRANGSTLGDLTLLQYRLRHYRSTIGTGRVRSVEPIEPGCGRGGLYAIDRSGS